jgi:hypothetical protein
VYKSKLRICKSKLRIWQAKLRIIVRTIIKPNAPTINLSIPAEYAGEDVETVFNQRETYCGNRTTAVDTPGPF